MIDKHLVPKTKTQHINNQKIINSLNSLSVYTADLLTGALPRGYSKVFKCIVTTQYKSNIN